MSSLPISIPKDINKYFFNRKKEIKKINANLSLLEMDIANQILITGYRGVGKTFLLKKILNDQPEKYLTIYLDLSKTYGGQKGELTEEELMKELLNKINEAIIKNENILTKVKGNISNFFKQLELKDYDISNINLSDIQLPEIKDNYLKLSKFVMELPQRIVDSSDNISGFIIVIDEFQLLKSLKNPEAFFWLIRTYTQEQFNVSYIFTGSVSQTGEIINMINGQNGAFGGRMLQFNIDPFSKEETKEYLNERLPSLKFSKEGFERFYACTRGIPAYINSLSSILPTDVECDEGLIKETLLLNVDQIVIMWLYVWGTLSSVEKEIIIFMVENGNVTWSLLNNNLSYAKSTITKYIDSLMNKGVIEYKFNKEYVLSDDMLKTWLEIKYDNDGIYPA
ncbi:AAA family ATPase [Methanobrevibacter olleyae]|uniref:Archaeal ATPase n=1 Tax=Methanobrevibacter olleyae TaxID=294671 RepID=A0A126QZ27_METOL|nr:ATP-binding protein [Methanobrevibacter olleyae]AMK15410.1 archaeal ATPase [Methanobrevibacter olleyae]SFL48497.1 hypothetical protein SAMN02910297_01012 [Methanobrevibacter olleyae]